jgi:hypothetical protein
VHACDSAPPVSAARVPPHMGSLACERRAGNGRAERKRKPRPKRGSFTPAGKSTRGSNPHRERGPRDLTRALIDARKQRNRGEHDHSYGWQHQHNELEFLQGHDRLS